MFTGKKFGRYEARSKIGVGGMGEVYEGFDSDLKRQVAIKILSTEFSVDENRKNRFHQEARAASALNHPNIITIHEIGENEHGNFLVTELVEGKTLREVLKTEILTIPHILKIAEQIANALAAAHKAGIIHRDIKPENVMIREDGIAKILDFGLAKPVAQDLGKIESDVELVKTVPGMVLGSVRYMSPEQARGVETDERSDIWSLGILLYEMLAKKTPFKGETTSDTIAALIHKQPEPLSVYVREVPVKLQQIIDKALEKNPADRYQKANDFAQEIKDLLYDIEHEISLEKIHSSVSEIDLSENPTIIHQTSGANYATKVNQSTTKETSDFSPSKRSNAFNIALFSLLAIAVITGLGFASYKWFYSGKNLADDSFEKIETTKIYTDGKVNSPAISPDGKYIAYVSGETGNRSLVLRQISTNSIVTLVEPQERNIFAVIFSPDGEFIYYLVNSKDFVINTLYRIPTLGGSPKEIIVDVDSVVTFSPDGKKLAFHRNVSKTSNVLIMTANIDGSNLETLIKSDDTDFNIINLPRWSPKEDVILVRVYNNFGGSSEEMSIGMISVADKKLTVLGEKKWDYLDYFQWLKDGSGIIFTGKENEDSPLQIWRATYPEGQVTAITNDVNNYFNISLSGNSDNMLAITGDTSSSLWSFTPSNQQAKQLLPESRNFDGDAGFIETPDGKFIYTRKEGKALSIWSSDKDFSNPQRLSNELENAYQLTLTPDGKQIVFGSRKSGTSRVWKIDIDGGNLTQLSPEREKYGDFTPNVTPDGKSVIFQDYASGANAQTAFRIVPVEGGELSTIYYDENYSVSGNEISPDGKYIAFTTYKKTNYDKKIRIVEFKEDKTFGETIKEFDADSVNSYIWSPGGKSLTFSSNRNGAPNLWQFPINGGEPKLLTNFKAGRIFNYAWSADGRNLYVVRGTVNNELILIRNKN